MKNPGKNKNTPLIEEIQQEKWTLMPFSTHQYWIVCREKEKTTFIATVENTGNEEKNKAIALLISKAPELLNLAEALYDGIRGTPMEKTILFYMIKNLLTEIKENERTRSIKHP